ncbi:transglycosylase SLT domain-containing protein [Flavobacteriaceae bacterium]|nr:transglycosylase SLT domain-containing protein [Flavobacteriaceae bacterium]MDC1539417.1 transglycosylase SLT domain-containing protein [Flavobacteriaceae bacterium]
MKHTLFLLVLNFGLLQAQSADSLAVETLAVIDSVQQRILKVEKQEERWRNEVLNNGIYDSLINAVSTQSYEAIYYPELPTDTLKKRLAILDAKTPFNISYNPSLESVIKGYLKNRQQSIETLINRSQYYFPMFEAVLDTHNLPLELKYLAVVESALKPRAKSRVGATGLWQFMFATGKQYGLEVSSYVDERCDPLRSTNAAAKYLASLYKTFGDWDLALAAYNSGPGNVTKAIRRSGGYQNYWNIRPFLPRETAGYLPAFLAILYLFEFADAHGFQVKKNQLPIMATDSIHVKQMITLDQVAEFTDTKIEILQYLNPSYKLDIIPVLKNKTYTLRLPFSKVADFVQNETQIYATAKAELEAREKPLPQFFKIDSKIRYSVKSGDYLGKIARRFRVRVSQIKQWNGLRTNDLKVGQRLVIYSRNPTAFTVDTPKTSAKRSLKRTNKTTYVVKPGDSLWSISNKLTGVSLQNLKDWNDIWDNQLKPGMRLIISN